MIIKLPPMNIQKYYLVKTMSLEQALLKLLRIKPPSVLLVAISKENISLMG